MKRFVDVRNQALGGRFCWYDTVTDEFESFNECQVFETWEEFEDDFDGDNLDRYRKLCPGWVFELEKDDKLRSVYHGRS